MMMRGNAKVKKASIPGADDSRTPPPAEAKNYTRLEANETTYFDDRMPPGKHAMAEVARYNRKKRGGRFSGYTTRDAANALRARA